MADRDPRDKRPVAYVPQDEGRFGRISELQSCWAPKGIRPEVAQQIIREYLYVYAAVCPALGKMTALILPWANTAMMNIFLEEVSRVLVISLSSCRWIKQAGTIPRILTSLRIYACYLSQLTVPNSIRWNMYGTNSGRRRFLTWRSNLSRKLSRLYATRLFVFKTIQTGSGP